MTVFDTQFARVNTPRNTAFGVSVVAHRDSDSSSAFTATIDPARDSVDPDDAFHDEFEYRVFRFAKSDYDLGSGAVEPLDGDELVFTENSVELTFAVGGPADDPSVTDREGGTRWHVMAKRIS